MICGIRGLSGGEAELLAFTGKEAFVVVPGGHVGVGGKGKHGKEGEADEFFHKLSLTLHRITSKPAAE